MSKATAKAADRGPAAESRFSVRFLVALLLFALGIAWVVYYYTVVRPGADGQPGGPKVFDTLRDFKGVNLNYILGFGLALIGLTVAAHPSTPLGRGRGVVVSMLSCFIVGLLWICTFYVVSDDPSKVPVMNDLGQYNLVLGIGLMAVGFAYATRWE